MSDFILTGEIIRIGGEGQEKVKQITDLKYNEIQWDIVDDAEKYGGFSLALVVEKDNWEKAIRISNSNKLPGNGYNSDDYYEVKAGDNSGTVAKDDQRFKYDVKRVDYCTSNDKPLKLTFMKPTGPIWVPALIIEIKKEQRSILGGKTLYVYWSKESDPKIFDDKVNRIKKGKFT